MKTKSKNIRKIITKDNKNFHDYQITLSPSYRQKIHRLIQFRIRVRNYDRKEENQEQHHKYYCISIHLDESTAFINNIYYPHRATKICENSILPDFVNDMAIFKEIEDRERKHRNEQNLQVIMKVLSELPEKQKRRFLSHYYDGLSINEIALSENVSRSSVYRSIRKTKAYIKDKLKINNELFVTYDSDCHK